MGFIIPLLLISFCCYIIWRAGDGFMTASEYVGRNLSEGVRGATINAVASSMPEVFTSMFFLLVMKNAEGFSGGIGTTAGSAIFNGMVIPGVSILAATAAGVIKRVKLSKRVLYRDGIALILAELSFLILISGSVLDWYHGLFLIFVYVIYMTYMFLTMPKKTKEEKEFREAEFYENNNEEEEEEKPSFLRSLLSLDLENIFIRTRINGMNAWGLLASSTLLIALVCYFLVLACEWVGSEVYTVPYLGEFQGLGVPVMFVALIIASAASSFPDTMISIKDAKKGQYDDAISNALGSNIFDICFALGLPLMIFTLAYGPIIMPEELVKLSSELRFLLWIMTVIAVVVFIYGEYFTRAKSYFLLSLYVLFVLYIIGRGMGNEVAQQIADFLVSIVHYFRIE